MNEPWTPKELIDSLSKWHPDQPIEVAIMPPAPGQIETSIILVQNNNAINLTAKGQA